MFWITILCYCWINVFCVCAYKITDGFIFKVNTLYILFSSPGCPVMKEALGEFLVWVPVFKLRASPPHSQLSVFSRSMVSTSSPRVLIPGGVTVRILFSRSCTSYTLSKFSPSFSNLAQKKFFLPLCVVEIMAHISPHVFPPYVLCYKLYALSVPGFAFEELKKKIFFQCYCIFPSQEAILKFKAKNLTCWIQLLLGSSVPSPL